MKDLSSLLENFYVTKTGELSNNISIEDAWLVVPILKKDGAYIEIGEIPEGWICSVWTKNSDLIFETRSQKNASLALIKAALRFYKIQGYHEA